MANAIAMFVSGPVWAEIKRRLRGLSPAYPEPSDSDGAVRSKSGQRQGWENCISNIDTMATIQEGESEEERRMRILADPKD